MSDQPYIGLRPFERDETDIFFGREQHSDELINCLGSHHFLAVIGTSGCGKSSLVKTGLIAGLEAGYLASVGTHWKIVEMRPGQQPFKVLAEKLFAELKDALQADYTQESLEQALRQGSLSLHELLGKYPLPNNAQLLIVCDQFEEIFRYFQQGDAAEAKNFVSLLLASSKPYPLSNAEVSNSVYVVITMRSDFLGDCAQFAGLAEAINQGLYLTPRLDAEQLRSAIEEPAFVFGGEVEPALVTQLLEDAQHSQDQLPLLQHILMRLWDLSVDKILTVQDYEKIGGLVRTGSPAKDDQSCDNNNALSRHADEVFNELSEAQQRIAKQVFCRLTRFESGKSDTRNPASVQELMDLTGQSLEQLAEVLKPFRQAGRCFLMPPINVDLTEDIIIDISHESLIRQWQTLQKWVAEEAQAAELYRHLLESALRYKNKQVGLLQPPELDIMLQWQKNFQPAAVWARRYGRYEEDFDKALSFLSISEEAYKQNLLAQEQARQEREELQKKVNTVLKASLSGAILTVVCLAGFGGWYYYAYERETIAYCNATAKRFGTLQCIGEIPAKDTKNRAVSFQFIRYGALNPIQKVRAVDSDGKCTDKHSLNAYLETEKRQQVEDKSENKANATDTKKADEKVLRECLWEYILDDKDNIVYEKSFDKTNKLVWGLVYSPHTKEERKAQAFFVGADGYPQPVINSLAEFVKFEYSESGDEKSISYFNREGEKQVANGWSVYHKAVKNYDNQGNKVEEAYFGLKNEPVLQYDIHKNRFKYDEKGYQIEEAYFGLKDEPILQYDIHKKRFKYDEKGYQIEEAYFGLKDEPVLQDYVHKTQFKYDEKGYQIEEAYFGLKDEPVLQDYVHKTQFKYDEKGYQIEQAYFGLKNEPILQNGIHKRNFKYDEKGYQIEQAYFGLKNEPILQNGIHKGIFKYNENGYKIEQSYFGLRNEPILDKDNVHKWTAKYDERGNKIEIAYFGLKNEPTLQNGIHKRTFKYDEKNNQIEETYFGLKNEPILQYGIHKITFKYDERGNQIETAYFGLKNEPILQYGIHKITFKYDERGNQIETANFGLKNKPILQNGIHKRTFKYDERGNQIETANFGLKNKPILQNGIHKRTFKYDERGNQIETANFGLKNEAVLYKVYDGSQYHKWTKKYDDTGKLIEETYFGLKNESVLLKNGYHKLIYKYDKKGSLIKKAYFGLNNKAILYKDSSGNQYHVWTAQYNENSKQTEVAYFGLNNEPIFYKDYDSSQYHKWTKKYDETGKLTEWAYFGVKSEPISLKEGYHKLIYKYDEKGNQIEIAYFGSKNEPILPKYGTEKSHYDYAYSAFKNGDYDHAIAEFQSVIRTYPYGEYADNSQYWTGEALLKKGDKIKAMIAFDKVISDYPRSQKVPDALLKIGITQASIGNKAKAREYYDYLIAAYPDTPAANAAYSKRLQTGL